MIPQPKFVVCGCGMMNHPLDVRFSGKCSLCHKPLPPIPPKKEKGGVESPTVRLPDNRRVATIRVARVR
jgi:hypothetical protein